jgi:hypothetical protein
VDVAEILSVGVCLSVDAEQQITQFRSGRCVSTEVSFYSDFFVSVSADCLTTLLVTPVIYRRMIR